MGLKETVNTMKSLLTEIGYDLEKANSGNKAASQRVRTASIRFEKLAKTYRKESVASEKKGGSSKPKAAAKKPAAKKAAKTVAKKPAAKKPAAKKKR